MTTSDRRKSFAPLEKEYKIRQVPCSWELDRRQQTRQEIEEVNRTWEFSVRRHLQQTIDELVDYKSPLNVLELLKHLDLRDVSHHVHYSEAGEMMGLSYSHKGVNFSGTSLGKAYTISSIIPDGRPTFDNLKPFKKESIVSRKNVKKLGRMPEKK